LGDFVQKNLAQPGVAILGYPDDEGIEINGGRKGAALGPDQIRRWLYRMTPHPKRQLKGFTDLGNLPPQTSLDLRHEEGRKIVFEHLRQEHHVLALGGGNDYAYADGMAFLDSFQDQRPIIINVDAHLDVRETDKGLSSGTPFYRLLESGVKFDFIELGIQSQCNSVKHWNYVEQKGGRILSFDELIDSGLSLTEFTVRALGDALLRRRPAFLAIDMDAFSWPYAVGTSAAWPLGLDPSDFYSCLQMFLKRLDVKVMGLYEVSPPLDQGGGTARLAAQFAHGFLHHV
jgi:formiminoglutamase